MKLNFSDWDVQNIVELNDGFFGGTAQLLKNGRHVADFDKASNVNWLTPQLEILYQKQLERDAFYALGEPSPDGFEGGYMYIAWLIRTRILEGHLKKLAQETNKLGIHVEFNEYARIINETFIIDDIKYPLTKNIDEADYFEMVLAILNKYGYDSDGMSYCYLWVLGDEGRSVNYIDVF